MMWWFTVISYHSESTYFIWIFVLLPTTSQLWPLNRNVSYLPFKMFFNYIICTRHTLEVMSRLLFTFWTALCTLGPLHSCNNRVHVPIHHGKSKIKTRFVTYCLTILIESPTKVPIQASIKILMKRHRAPQNYCDLSSSIWWLAQIIEVSHVRC